LTFTENARVLFVEDATGHWKRNIPFILCKLNTRKDFNSKIGDNSITK